MSSINSYGLDVVAPYVLVLQLLVAALVFRVGRWQWLRKYLVALPIIWILSIVLYSGHCLACGEGLWVLPLGFLYVQFITLGRARRIERGRSREGA
jgi:hypothetical protein